MPAGKNGEFYRFIPDWCYDASFYSIVWFHWRETKLHWGPLELNFWMFLWFFFWNSKTHHNALVSAISLPLSSGQKVRFLGCPHFYMSVFFKSKGQSISSNKWVLFKNRPKRQYFMHITHLNSSPSCYLCMRRRGVLFKIESTWVICQKYGRFGRISNRTH